MASPFTDLFGCEERVENALTYILWDTAAVVANPNFSPFFIVISGDVDTPHSVGLGFLHSGDRVCRVDQHIKCLSINSHDFVQDNHSGRQCLECNGERSVFSYRGTNLRNQSVEP